MDVLDMVELGDMPPEDAKNHPSDQAILAFTETIRGARCHVAESHDQIERPEIRRLSHSAMDHTVRDLTGVELPLSTDLPDGSLPQGSGAAPPPARTAGEIQLASTASVLRERIWLDAGESFYLQYGSGIRQNGTIYTTVKGEELPIEEAIYVRAIGVAGPLQTQWPLPLMRLIELEEATRSQKIEALLTRIFRRPPDQQTLSLYQALFDQRYTQTKNETFAFRQVLEAALCSPRFLFNYDDGIINQSWATACRLSYFLWNSTPDGRLFNLAAKGELTDPTIVGEEARRMLADPRSGRFVEDFTGQWLNTRHVGKMVPDAKLFPNYDRFLEEAIKTELGAFFAEVLSQNLSVSSFLDSDFVVINDRLAKHYGIEDADGPEFRAVKLDKKSPRGGVLGQASLMTATSDGTRTSPVIRGIWVLENILGSHVSPPPADVKPLEPDVRGALSIREMLEKHRTVETCNECHRKIDPLGFALENFNLIGEWRDQYVTKKTRIVPLPAARFTRPDACPMAPRLRTFRV